MKARDGFCFVGVRGNGLDEARELEDFADVAGGIEQFQATGVALERDEGADQRADPGAIDLLDAFKIDQNVARRSFGKAPQLGAERVVTDADRDTPSQIEDRNVPGLSRRDLQAHIRLPGIRDNTGRRVRIITPQVLEQASDREAV